MTTSDRDDSISPGWPVLVTGAGGFVGGHVVRALARAGYRVRAWTRSWRHVPSGDLTIEQIIGDLRDPSDRARAVAGMRGVVHVAGWVSLGSDPRGESRAVNVEATRALLDLAAQAGVERFVYTSTLWTVAAGTAGTPADEETEWNLIRLRSPYCETKREAERLVLERNGPGFRTAVLCPGLVVGPGDVRPTSTRLLLAMAKTTVALLPGGGIPVVDARVLAEAHVAALERAEPGRRYVVAGPYLSYPQIAALVARVANRPKRVLIIPDSCERPLAWAANCLDRCFRGRLLDISAVAVAGGFLRLHVSGARADRAFGLRHPPPIQSVFDTLEDCRRSGRAAWLRPLTPVGDG